MVGFELVRFRGSKCAILDAWKCGFGGGNSIGCYSPARPAIFAQVQVPLMR